MINYQLLQVLRKTSSETGTTNGANGQSVLNPKCLSDEELLTHTYSVLGVMPAYALQKVFAVSNETDEENAGLLLKLPFYCVFNCP